MGGRGARSGGRGGRAPNGYHTVGRIHGIPVIRNKVTGKGLPRQAKSGSTHFGTDSSGKINQIRVYGKSGKVAKDYDWSHPFEGHPAGTVHSHKWRNGERAKEHSPLTEAEIRRYKDAIEKATGRSDFIWKW